MYSKMSNFNYYVHEYSWNLVCIVKLFFFPSYMEDQREYTCKEDKCWNGEIYDCVMGCHHSQPLICLHASNIRTTPLVDKLVKKKNGEWLVSLSLSSIFSFDIIIYGIYLSLSICKVKTYIHEEKKNYSILGV